MRLEGIRRRWWRFTEHPILQLELRRFRRWKWWSIPRLGLLALLLVLLLAIPGLGLGLLLLLTEPDSASSLEVGAVFACCPMGSLMTLVRLAVVWMAPTIAATAIAREKEGGTWELLRTTPLTSWELVLGKLGGCVGLLAPGLILMLLLTPFKVAWDSVTATFTSLLYTLSGTYGWSWVLLPISLASQLPTWSHLALHLAVGLFISTLSRSSGVAVALSYATILVLRILFLILGWMLNLLLFALFDAGLLGSMAVTYSWIGLTLSPLLLFSVELLIAIGLIVAAALWLGRG